MLELFKRNFLFTFVLLFGLACASTKTESNMLEASLLNDSEKEKEISYLALGDSYTIGTGLDVTALNYPTQLAKRLDSESNFSYPKVRIIAENGWTTSDLIQAVDNEDLDSSYSLVSLLIGVNNQYQGGSINDYISEFELLLIKALSFAANDTSNIFVISIPDYGVTPFGQAKAMQIEKEINMYNAINDSISSAFGVSYFNITDISRKAINNDSLIASDNLHPSGTMYKEWIDTFYAEVLRKVN